MPLNAVGDGRAADSDGPRLWPLGLRGGGQGEGGGCRERREGRKNGFQSVSFCRRFYLEHGDRDGVAQLRAGECAANEVQIGPADVADAVPHNCFHRSLQLAKLTALAVTVGHAHLGRFGAVVGGLRVRVFSHLCWSDLRLNVTASGEGLNIAR